VGRGYAEVTETGAAVPPRIAERLAERGMDVRARVAEAGLGVRDGLLAHDAEGMGATLRSGQRHCAEGTELHWGRRAGTMPVRARESALVTAYFLGRRIRPFRGEPRVPRTPADKSTAPGYRDLPCHSRQGRWGSLRDGECRYGLMPPHAR